MRASWPKHSQSRWSFEESLILRRSLLFSDPARGRHLDTLVTETMSRAANILKRPRGHFTELKSNVLWERESRKMW